MPKKNNETINELNIIKYILTLSKSEKDPNIEGHERSQQLIKRLLQRRNNGGNHLC
jgi:hypothetical protein